MVAEKGYVCTECHADVTDLSHTGPLPATVTFAPNAIANARGYVVSYSHSGDVNSGNATCVVYCHSNGRGANWTMEQRQPNEPVPQWTDTYEFTCTSCHSIPPQNPHPQVQTCHICHTNVDPTSQYPNDIRFINEQLHVNGVVDF
jgi:predicted CxxxxCH...CXXCH cytochrome family protein